jgi:hypothetical protein
VQSLTETPRYPRRSSKELKNKTLRKETELSALYWKILPKRIYIKSRNITVPTGRVKNGLIDFPKHRARAQSQAFFFSQIQYILSPHLY